MYHNNRNSTTVYLALKPDWRGLWKLVDSQIWHIITFVKWDYIWLPDLLYVNTKAANFQMLSATCICLHTYVGCRSETASETCIDCSRVKESVCGCKDRHFFIHFLPSNQCIGLVLTCYYLLIAGVVLFVSVIATALRVRVPPPSAATATSVEMKRPWFPDIPAPSQNWYKLFETMSVF